jgi:integrase
MRGSTRQRAPGAPWQYRIEVSTAAERCPACTEAGRKPARWWLGDKPLAVCPTCGADLLEVDEARQQTVSGFPTQRAAQGALNKALVSVQEGHYVTPAKLTVRQFLHDEWLPAVKGRVRPSTYASYEMHVRIYLAPMLGGVRLQGLTPARIDGVYTKLAAEGRRGRGISPTTIARIHATLHAALRMAVERRYVVFNAADTARPPRAKGEDVHEMATWSAEDVKAFLAHVRGDREYPLWRLLVCTGLRRGEALGLRWSDVLFIPAETDGGEETARLSIRHTIVAVDYVAQDSEPKTSRGRRTVPVDPATAAALREQIERQQDDRREWKEAWVDSGLVFTAENGEALHPGRASRSFERAVRGAPVPRIRLHDLRHTAITRMLEAGVPVKVVSEIVGHASVAFTMDRYGHVIPSMQESAVTLLADLYDR